MAEPIRVVHFADVHVGMENYGRLDPVSGTSSRVRDFLDRLDEVVDYAIGHDGDLAIFAGDAFKSRDPEPTQQREFAARIKRLADAMPTLLLVGNHDMPGMAAKASSVDIFGALQVPGVIVGDRPGSRVVATRRGPVFLAWIPYPMRNRLLARDESQGKTIDELDEALRRAVADLMASQAEEARRQDMPRLLVGHLAVAEAKLGSERTILLGRDVGLATSSFADPAWDYVALGHIHRHQDLHPGAAPPVVYSGSLERIDFGEEDEAKGFCWVELARGGTRWQFVPVAARTFRTVRVDVRRSEDPTAAVVEAAQGADAGGAVVRVLVRIRADQEPLLRERDIQEALAQASSVVVGRDTEPENRVRLGDLSPEALSPLQLIERYFRDQGAEEPRVASLIERAAELIAPDEGGG
ncbi:MAG TPA: exonuclease SbcCD subunit D [Anaerolineales bacterium]|nr:exonuclease SbcCD subunit D [Anaerolineales bacterium]